MYHIGLRIGNDVSIYKFYSAESSSISDESQHKVLSGRLVSYTIISYIFSLCDRQN